MTNAIIIEDLTLVTVPVWWQSPWFIAFLVLALAALGFFLHRWWKNRPLPAPVHPPVPPGPPPHLEALRRLADLRARHAALDAYAVAIECSDILRTYIEGRFGLPIRFQTTREFLGAAQSVPALDAEAQMQLGVFLNFFDRLKFARANAQPAETLEAMDGAERFIQRCIPAGAGEPQAR